MDSSLTVEEVQKSVTGCIAGVGGGASSPSSAASCVAPPANHIIQPRHPCKPFTKHTFYIYPAPTPACGGSTRVSPASHGVCPRRTCRDNSSSAAVPQRACIQCSDPGTGATAQEHQGRARMHAAAPPGPARRMLPAAWCLVAVLLAHAAGAGGWLSRPRLVFSGHPAHANAVDEGMVTHEGGRTASTLPLVPLAQYRPAAARSGS